MLIYRVRSIITFFLLSALLWSLSHQAWLEMDAVKHWGIKTYKWHDTSWMDIVSDAILAIMFGFFALLTTLVFLASLLSKSNSEYNWLRYRMSKRKKRRKAIEKRALKRLKK